LGGEGNGKRGGGGDFLKCFLKEFFLEWHGKETLANSKGGEGMDQGPQKYVKALRK
jgi:hypothetical protein